MDRGYIAVVVLLKSNGCLKAIVVLMLFVLATCFNGYMMSCNENTTSYLKNHWTKHGLVSTHFRPFFILNPNMGTIFNNSNFLIILQMRMGREDERVKVVILFMVDLLQRSNFHDL